MIIILITIVLFVLGVVGRVYYKEKIEYIVRKYDFFIDSTTLIILVVCSIAIIIEMPAIIAAQCTANKDIYEYNLQRESIVKQVECISSNYEDVSKATVIENVYDWNKEVYNTKYWAKNPWTSWFYSQKFVDSLEYIELED